MLFLLWKGKESLNGQEVEQLELLGEKAEAELFSCIYHRPDLTINAKWIKLISADSLSASLLIIYETMQSMVQLFHFEWKDPLDFVHRMMPSLPHFEEHRESATNLTLRMALERPDADLATNLFSSFARVKGIYRGAASLLMEAISPTAKEDTEEWQANPWIRERHLELPPPIWTAHHVGLDRLEKVPYDTARRLILAAGLEPDGARAHWWRILLGIRKPEHSDVEYQEVLAEGEEEYWELVEQADELFEQGDPACIDLYRRIDKDVYRCDRHLSLFQPHTTDPDVDLKLPGLQSMRRILRAHAILDPELDYAQGMADLLSPLLLVMEGDEVEAFLLLTRLMHRQRALFMAGGEPVHQRLGLLWAMLCTVDPQLADYLACAPDGGKLFFSYRWLLVWFRREWPLPQCLQLWDRIIIDPHYDLYLSLAIYDLMRPHLTSIKPRFDELFQLFTESVGKLSVDAVLQRASQFQQHFVIYRARYQLDPDLQGLYRE